MTTIATDGKTMAGDGQREVRGTISTLAAEKVRRLKDGSLLGTCGDVALGVTVVKWLNGEGEKPAAEVESGFNALLLKTDGDLMLLDQFCCPTLIQAPFAVGSGMDLAIGAMLAGKSPAEAVAIAATRDSGTGGVILEFELHPKAKLEAA